MHTTAPNLDESWKLEDLYGNDDAFARAKAEFQEKVLPPLDGYRGHLLDSPARLADALDAACGAREQLQLLYSYASMRSDADTRVASYQAMRQQVQLLATELSKSVAYLRPEILAADRALIDGFLESEPRLAPHRFFLDDLQRQAAHVLGPDEERIVAEAGLLTGEPNSLYQVLTNAELPRPEMTLTDGETIRLTPTTFQKHRAIASREDRLVMFPRYFAAYDTFKDSLGQNLFAAVKAHLFRARVRGYDSCLEAALEPQNIPQSVYRNLVARIREHLPVLHRYFDLRRRAAGVERLEYPDLYGPFTSQPLRRFSTAEARRMVSASMKPLGSEYGDALDRAFDARWIDWHPADGKRSGAYANGWAYHVHPYVMLNFNGDHDGVSTLAHEMGHAMHSHFSNRRQPFATADYSIFVAEVASTFNEALLLRHLLAAADSPQERLFLLGSYLDGIRATLFRQAMFAEFELEIHERVERGEVLTGELLNSIYLGLLRDYHGHNDGLVYIAEDYAVEWAAIPHMYFDFYVYQYSTGITAATALARLVTEGPEDARSSYLDFLGSGGSDYPLELLRRAGVDLEQAQPYHDAFALIGERLDQMEALFASPEAGSAAP